MDDGFELRILTEILEIKKKLDDIQRDLNSMKSENVVLKQQIQSGSVQPQQESARGSFDRGATSTHPRTGGLAPKDVAIEKFFYSGAKK